MSAKHYTERWQQAFLCTPVKTLIIVLVTWTSNERAILCVTVRERAVTLDVACKRALVYQSRTREAYRRHPVRYAHCHLAYKLN